jgi:hypothetical protein
MNYILEDNFDFYGELHNKNESKMVEATPQTAAAGTCFISHQPLTYNAITLSCKHTFNYIPLYTELFLHNNRSFINCPYCREKSEKLIPYIPLPTVEKVYGVNYPVKNCMPAPKCKFIYKKGFPCQQNGMEYADGTFCSKHLKPAINDTQWTLEKIKLYESKTVPELKEMLRAKGLKVGGVKKELVNRLLLSIKI